MSRTGLTAFVALLLLAFPAAADEKQKCIDDGAQLDFILPLMVQAVAEQRNTEDYRKLGPEGQKIWEDTYSEKALAKQWASEFTSNCVQRYNCQEAKDAYQRGAIPETAKKSYQQLMRFILDICG